MTTSLLIDRELSSRFSDIVTPFTERQVSEGTISYGLSSMGYDIRLGRKFLIFTDTHCRMIDPKKFAASSYRTHHGTTCLIPPHAFVLGESVERFRMPPNVLGLCIGKSTYARCGIIVNITPIEPGWRGILTIEISNTSPLPAKLYADEGIAQVLFFKTASRPRITYADRNGKYQDQAQVTGPRMTPDAA